MGGVKTMSLKIKPAVQVGDPVIRGKAKKVMNIASPETRSVIASLVAHMRHHGLIGMAAPQIGSDLQIFVTEIRKTATRKTVKETSALQVYINPRILSLSKVETLLYEGCGSLAHGQLFGPVKRPSKVTVQAFDEHGELFILPADGLLAKCIQHEYDHLQGIVCIDKFTDTRKVMCREEYLKR